MSYVLDALRKSEQERQVAAGAHAGVLHPVMLDQSAASRRWPLALIFFAAVVVLALAWQFWPRPARERASAPATAAASSHAAGPTSRIATLPAVAPVPSPRPAGSKPPPSAGLQSAYPPESRPPAVSTASPPTAPAAAAAGTDLPPGLAKELPPLVISGFINDEQAGSMAVIDDKLLREGDEVAPGLRLEKIFADGAQFSYKGYRFRR